MPEHFVHYLSQYAPGITREEIDMVCKVAMIKRVSKRQLLFAEGEVWRVKIFVVKGLLKNYIISENGTEHIIKFTAENGWTTDADSYNFGKPAICSIGAIEESEVILLEHDAYEHLRTIIPALNAFSENMLLQRIADTQQRILTNISSSAEEQYADFIAHHPHIHQRIPLHMIAAYLGLSRETLTRVRHNQLMQAKKQVTFTR